MDQIKVGRFLAELRHGEHMTQEALAERIGVTNKTISRWERGNYMPDIEMLQALSQIYGVSVDELLAGERGSDDQAVRARTEESVAVAIKPSVFSHGEQQAYWKRKWRREHKTLLACLALAVLALATVPWLIQRPWFAGLAPLGGVIAYGYQNNRMMAYVEKQVYGPSK